MGFTDSSCGTAGVEVSPLSLLVVQGHSPVEDSGVQDPPPPWVQGRLEHPKCA